MKIQNKHQFLALLAEGPWAWPGGYPLFFVTSDGEALSFRSAEQNQQAICEAIAEGDTSDSWFVIGVEINYEDAELYCCHSGERIESAYAETNATP